MRVDKWLWQARFFKSRSLSAACVSGGHMRINGNHVSKPSANVAVGDVLTFTQADHVRVVRIAALGTRRGPAAEAQTLYEDLTPTDEAEKHVPPIARIEGNSRPTKRDRRKLDLDRRGALE
ncbi:RNA-binding S4 domain-containing protein [Pseudooceanicola sediminis]|uniref:RNA-binding S4 domain-containing protein n=1 Tax=Pseudooceanicola sediminis TaxID=2211117 RepID=A0A399J5M9_9RHOB|nr:RNA-binding S4 domain-containing protein [Pseudooceanicola sediminis]KAA2312113.1 RNA-binding S4 domain-containing protein [Puniceibacterium sp. HSS470]RII38126.1 RNA-binding S4 domain-containing protein [Pseudooceanicola sediminis]